MPTQIKKEVMNSSKTVTKNPRDAEVAPEYASNMLEFHGHHCLRQVVILSMLSGKQIIVKGIRSEEDNPGLKDYEVDLLKLVQKISNGTDVNINKTGTRLILKPGIIDSGEGLSVEHNCHLGRSITYYLECVCILGIFGKSMMNLKLHGNTDDSTDQSIESFKSSISCLLTHFGASGSLSIQVKKRGFAPQGGGLVQVTQSFVRMLEAVSLVDEGKVKRVRGIVTSAKVSP